jgi:hypothetical protein
MVPLAACMLVEFEAQKRAGLTENIGRDMMGCTVAILSIGQWL